MPIILALFLSGCSIITYQHGATQVSEHTFLLGRQVGHLEIRDETGSAVVDQAQTDETQAVSAAVKAAVQALK